MLDITSVENAIRAWVVDVSGLETIFAHPNAPRLSSPYVLINLVQNTPSGTREAKAVLLHDDSIDVEYSNVEELLVSVNTYYTGAYQNATLLKDSLGRVTVTDQLFSDGLGYARATGVRDIPERINKRWEERAQFDCVFSVRSLDSENIETIQKIGLTNEINDESTIVEEA